MRSSSSLSVGSGNASAGVAEVPNDAFRGVLDEGRRPGGRSTPGGTSGGCAGAGAGGGGGATERAGAVAVRACTGGGRAGGRRGLELFEPDLETLQLRRLELQEPLQTLQAGVLDLPGLRGRSPENQGL